MEKLGILFLFLWSWDSQVKTFIMRTYIFVYLVIICIFKKFLCFEMYALFNIQNANKF